jgi:hypothetical protein
VLLAALPFGFKAFHQVFAIRIIHGFLFFHFAKSLDSDLQLIHVTAAINTDKQMQVHS